MLLLLLLFLLLYTLFGWKLINNKVFETSLLKLFLFQIIKKTLRESFVNTQFEEKGSLSEEKSDECNGKEFFSGLDTWLISLMNIHKLIININNFKGLFPRYVWIVCIYAQCMFLKWLITFWWDFLLQVLYYVFFFNVWYGCENSYIFNINISNLINR